MNAICAEINVAAPSQRVWESSPTSRPTHNGTRCSRKRRATSPVGSKLRFLITPPGGRAMRISPAVLAVVAPRELRWRGGAPIQGLFSGEHSFLIEPRGESSSHLAHSEPFRGILVPLPGRVLRNTQRSFEEMNRALNARCEAGG